MSSSIETSTVKEPTSLTVSLDSGTYNRILSAYQRDQQEFSRSEKEFSEWLLGIILDWVEEVEKPVPTRDIGFGN
jgi:hypothetical protein